MIARRLFLLVLLPALALFCAGCAGLRSPDHVVFGLERDESEISGPTRQRMSTDKADCHVVYDLPRPTP